MPQLDFDILITFHPGTFLTTATTERGLSALRAHMVPMIDSMSGRVPEDAAEALLEALDAEGVITFTLG